MLGLEIDMMALYYMAWGALGALIVGVIFLAITWIFVFPRAGNRWLTRVKNPDSTENKMIGDVGEVMIDKMYPKMIEKFEGDAGRFLNSAVKNLDIDGYIGQAKDRFKQEVQTFSDKLGEPPKVSTNPDGQEIVTFNNEQKFMYNMVSAAIQNGIGFIPHILQKDEKGNWTVPDEVKMAGEWSEDYMIKRFTLILNKLKGQFSGMAEMIPQEILNNPDLISSIAEGGLAKLDPAQFIPLLGEKDAGKLGALVEVAPTLIKMYKLFQGYTAQAGPGAAVTSGPVARSGIQNF